MPQVAWPWVSRREYRRVVEALKLAIIVIDSMPPAENVERVVRVKASVPK